MAQIAAIKSFLEPESLAECLAILAEKGERAHVIAGGQSILPILKTRGIRPEALVSLARVAELSRREIGAGDDGALLLGAMCRHRDIWSESDIRQGWGALADAAACVGDRQIQNRGTIGGNLAFGTVVTDMKQVAMCLDADLTIAGPEGERTVSALEIFSDIHRSLLLPGELLTQIRFAPPGKGGASAYRKYGITANGRPVIGIAAMVRLGADGVCEAARIVVGGLVPTPNVARYSAEMLVGKVPDASTIGAVADGVAEEIKPQSDNRASGSYRRQLVRVYGRQVLELALDRARKDIA